MSCSRCDGRPEVFAQEVARELGALLGPKRRDEARRHQHGGKGIIKWNPTTAETQSGITKEITPVAWSSPDGDAHTVTVEIGRQRAGGAGTFPSGGLSTQTATVGGDNIPTSGVPLGGVSVVSTAGFPTSGTLAYQDPNTGLVTTGVTYNGITAKAFLNLLSPNGAITTKNAAIITQPLSFRADALIITGQTSLIQDPFFMDIGRGQRFSVTASYVAVTLKMNEPAPGYISGSMPVYAGLGHGEALSQSPVLKTEYIDMLTNVAGANAANVKNIIVPPKANLLMPLRSSDINNQVQVDFLDNVGAIIDSLQFGNGGMVSAAEMSDDVYSINITNQGTKAVNYRAVFQLSV